MTDGLIVVLSGPSGVGKGTVKKLLDKKIPNLRYTVSVTTRKPREGEQEGVNYYYRTDAEFDALIASDSFVEYASTFAHRYGTLKSELERLKAQGCVALLEIDTKGAFNVRKQFSDAVLIFVLPPSAEELERRIRGRGSESEEELRRRLAEAEIELACADKYDYRVVNEDLDGCADQIADIIKKVIQARA